MNDVLVLNLVFRGIVAIMAIFSFLNAIGYESAPHRNAVCLGCSIAFLGAVVYTVGLALFFNLYIYETGFAALIYVLWPVFLGVLIPLLLVSGNKKLKNPKLVRDCYFIRESEAMNCLSNGTKAIRIMDDESKVETLDLGDYLISCVHCETNPHIHIEDDLMTLYSTLVETHEKSESSE